MRLSVRIGVKAMLDNNVVLEINKNVLKRFEPNLNDGTVFLFDIKNEKFWTGNAAVDCLLRLIDGETNLAQIMIQSYLVCSKKDFW